MSDATTASMEHAVADNSPPQTDFRSHLKGYSKFITVFKWGAIIVALITMIIVYVIAS